MKKRNRNLTPADKEAARKLRALWDRAVHERKASRTPLTQDRMAERLASTTGRGTQGLVSQYLNGLIALNFRALLAFADEVGFDPRDVREDLPEQQLQAGFGRRIEEPSSTPYRYVQETQELAELRLVIGLTAKALAATIQPAGKELLAALQKLPKAMKAREFVRETIEAIQSELPDQQAVRKAQGSASRKRP